MHNWETQPFNQVNNCIFLVVLKLDFGNIFPPYLEELKLQVIALRTTLRDV